MRLRNFKSHALLLLSASCGTMMIASQAAQAQIDDATASANPSRVQEQFLDRDLVADVSPSVQVEDAILQDVPPNADKIQFRLTSIALEGVSAYQESDVASIYQDKLGTTVSLADIYAISTALTNKYRNEGFILTQVVVPPQTIEGGAVRLRVVEGFVDRVLVQGEEGDTGLGLVQEYANRIRTGGPLNVEELEHYLLLINDIPGLSARSVISPSRTQTGGADLRIIVERDHFEGLLAIDNFGSRFLGPVQLTAGGALNSFFGNNELISAQFVVAPDPNVAELAFGALSYEQPINSYGTTARAFVSGSATRPGFFLDDFDVRGNSRQYGVAVEHPFIRSRAENLSARVQFDFRDLKSRSNIVDTVEDNIRALRVGGRYEKLDTVFGVGINSLDVEVSAGLDVFGSSDDGDANLTRSEASPDFYKINAEFQRLQRITSDVNLLMAARGQLSNRALFSSEEFSVGGINYGRAFDPSEIIGDDGFATKLEVQWTQPFEAAIFNDYQLYGFWDFGKVYNDDATIDDDDESIASVGAGIRAEFLNEIEGGFGVAFPLTRDVETQRDDDPRFYMNLNRRF